LSKGDKTRTSVVVVPKPFMGLIEDETSSWSEPVYGSAWSNSCCKHTVVALTDAPATLAGAQRTPASTMAAGAESCRWATSTATRRVRI
jgi:hypothetical protein